jgi:hypothetical protein
VFALQGARVDQGAASVSGEETRAGAGEASAISDKDSSMNEIARPAGIYERIWAERAHTDCWCDECWATWHGKARPRPLSFRRYLAQPDQEPCE